MLIASKEEDHDHMVATVFTLQTKHADGQGEGKYVVLCNSLQVWKGLDIFSKEDFRFQLLVVYTPEFAQIIFTMYAKSQRAPGYVDFALTRVFRKH